MKLLQESIKPSDKLRKQLIYIKLIIIIVLIIMVIDNLYIFWYNNTNNILFLFILFEIHITKFYGFVNVYTVLAFFSFVQVFTKLGFYIQINRSFRKHKILYIFYSSLLLFYIFSVLILFEAYKEMKYLFLIEKNKKKEGEELSENSISD